jgi:hypothetical protein
MRWLRSVCTPRWTRSDETFCRACDGKQLGRQKRALSHLPGDTRAKALGFRILSTPTECSGMPFPGLGAGDSWPGGRWVLGAS